MARRKRVGETTSAKLFTEDIIEPKRKSQCRRRQNFQQSGQVFSEQLFDDQRMERYGDTAQVKGFKTAPPQLLQPPIANNRDLTKFTSAIQAEFFDNRSVPAR